MRLDDKEIARILAYLAAGNSIQATAEKFKRCNTTIRDVRNGYRPGGQPAARGKQSKCEYMPTPEEIEQAKDEIQAGWTPSEEWSRRVSKPHAQQERARLELSVYTMSLSGRTGRAFFEIQG